MQDQLVQIASPNPKPQHFLRSCHLSKMPTDLITTPTSLFMISTLPTWILLTCSIALQSQSRRAKILGVISLPLPIGLGIVFFSICDIPNMHYVFVNIFVLSVGVVHVIVATTAGHINFLQSYFVLLVGTAIFGLCFLVLAFTSHGPSMQRDIAVILEYLAVTGFIVLNSLVTDRVREHLENRPQIP